MSRRLRDAIPRKFYRWDERGSRKAKTVGELKALLDELPASLPIEQGMEKGVLVVVFNIDSNTHLRFQEIDE